MSISRDDLEKDLDAIFDQYLDDDSEYEQADQRQRYNDHKANERQPW